MWHVCRISVRRENGLLMGVTRTSNGTGKLIAALLSFFLIEAGGLIGYVVGSLFGFDIDISYTFAQAVVAILVLIGLGGGSYLRFDRDAIIESWKFMWWIIVLSAILMVWDLSDFVLAGEVVQRGWFLRCLSSLLLCVCIGISEEGMFRGTLFGGLLARFGEKKNGILWCVALSSLAFGCAHVLPEDFDFTRWYTVVQALLKICQTGIYAVMLCTVVLKTRSFVGAMMIHALDDYLLFIVSTGLYGETFETEYVTAEADEGIVTIIFYLVIIALYMPTFIKSVRYLMKVQAPQFGPFVQEAPALDAGWQPYVQSYAPQMAQPVQPVQEPTYYAMPMPAQPLMPTSTVAGPENYQDGAAYPQVVQPTYPQAAQPSYPAYPTYPAEQAPQQWYGQEPVQPGTPVSAQAEPQMYPQWQAPQPYAQQPQVQQPYQQPQVQQPYQQPYLQRTPRRPPRPEGL